MGPPPTSGRAPTPGEPGDGVGQVPALRTLPPSASPGGDGGAPRRECVGLTRAGGPGAPLILQAPSYPPNSGGGLTTPLGREPPQAKGHLGRRARSAAGGSPQPRPEGWRRGTQRPVDPSRQGNRPEALRAAGRQPAARRCLTPHRPRAALWDVLLELSKTHRESRR